MRTIVQKLSASKGKDFATVGVTSCWHVGNPQCRRDHIEAMMDEFKERRLPWIHLGDTIEAITPLDKRYCQASHAESVMLQLHDAAELISRAKATLIGITIGNHEDKLVRQVGDVTRDMLRRVYKRSADERWLAGAANVLFQLPDGRCQAFFAHSNLSVATGGTSDPERDYVNRQIRLRRRLSPFQADLKVVGHGHHAIVAPPVMRDLLVTAGGRTPTMQPHAIKAGWVAMCPSMLASYDDGDYPSYAELALYAPTDIGWVECDIYRDGAVKEVRVRVIR